MQYYYYKNGYSLAKFPQMIDDIRAVTLEDVDAAAEAVEGSRKQIYEEPSELEEPEV